MNGLLDKSSVSQEIVASSWPEKFSTDCLERCVDVFRGLKTDAQMMILAIDSQDYVGMLVHEFAKNNPETQNPQYIVQQGSAKDDQRPVPRPVRVIFIRLA